PPIPPSTCGTSRRAASTRPRPGSTSTSRSSSTEAPRAAPRRPRCRRLVTLGGAWPCYGESRSRGLGAMGFRIKRKERVDEAVRRIVRAQLGAAIRVARETDGSQEDRVHEVRTRLKRSRAALALIGRRVGKAAERDDKRLRDAARRLARPRDLAVQAHTFRVLRTRL